jgi:hypothetical protein
VSLRKSERLQAGFIAQIRGREHCYPGALVQREGEDNLRWRRGKCRRGLDIGAQLGIVVIPGGGREQDQGPRGKTLPKLGLELQQRNIQQIR